MASFPSPAGWVPRGKTHKRMKPPSNFPWLGLCRAFWLSDLSALSLKQFIYYISGFSYPGTGSHGGFYFSKLWSSGSAFLSLQFWGSGLPCDLTCLKDLRSFDSSVSSGFHLLRVEWQFPNLYVPDQKPEVSSSTLNSKSMPLIFLILHFRFLFCFLFLKEINILPFGRSANALFCTIC